MTTAVTKRRDQGWVLMITQRAALFAIGCTSLLWQVTAARSIMAGLYGNELILGLVLGTWLALMGLATGWLVSRINQRYTESLAFYSLSLIPASLLLSIIIQGATLPAFSAIPLTIGPGRALSTAFFCLLFPCLLLGASFAMLSRLVSQDRDSSASRWAARVFLWESLGTVIAGMIFHFFLAQWAGTSVALLAGAVPWLTSWLFLSRQTLLWRWLGIITLSIGGLSLLYLMPWHQLIAPFPGSHLLKPQYPGFQLLAKQNSPHAALAVLQRGDQVLFTANGQVLFTNQDEQQAEAETHLPLLAHPSPDRVLIIGGGLGGGLREALKHPIRQLEYVELDPQVVDLARQFGGETLNTVLHDPRLQIHIGDGRQLINQHSNRYDVILISMPGPISAMMNRFYTQELFTQARRALRPGGLLRLTLAGHEGYLSPELTLIHSSIMAALQRSFAEVLPLPAQQTMILASPKPIDLRLATLIKRFSNRKISTHFFGMADILDRTIPFKRELYQQQLATEHTPPVNTDLQPTAYFHASLHWLAISSPTLSRYLLKIAAFSNDHRWLFWAGGFLLTLLWRLARGKSGGTGIALFLAGLIGMALEITILLAHQEFRGVVYQDLGMLLAAFMLGLTMGAPLGHWLFIRWPGGALSSAFSGTWSVSWIILLIFKFADQWALTSIFWFIVPLLLLGISIGACYSPASAMMAHRLKERAAAHAYAWDIGGAAIGALFISAFILPLLGLPGTCWLCAALASGWLVGQMILLCKK